MPLVRIELIKGALERQVCCIAHAVQQALVECLRVPKRDRFQVIAEHDSTRFIYDKSYLEVKRSDGIVFVQVFLSKGRTLEQKSAFYARLANLLSSEAKVRPE